MSVDYDTNTIDLNQLTTPLGVAAKDSDRNSESLLKKPTQMSLDASLREIQIKDMAEELIDFP